MLTATQKSLLGNDDSHKKAYTWQLWQAQNKLLSNADSHIKSLLGNDDSYTKKLT
jgi:hypothetical protein